MLNIYTTSRNINIALIKMVVPKSKIQSEDSCLATEGLEQNSTISSSNTTSSNSISSNITEMFDSRFDWNDQEQGSILEQGILIVYIRVYSEVH